MTKEQAKRITNLEEDGDIGEVMDFIMKECDVENVPSDDLDEMIKELDKRYNELMG